MLNDLKKLIDSFEIWYSKDEHSKNEDRYLESIRKDSLANMTDDNFISFFYQFAHDGGGVQSGGYRTKNQLRDSIQKNIAKFRNFIMEPFEPDFDSSNWLDRLPEFDHFGKGLATIFLNRVDKKRFPILNNKTEDALKNLGFEITGNLGEKYLKVSDAQTALINQYQQLDNFFKADSLNHYLIAVDEGKQLISEIFAENKNYWIFQGNPKAYDVIGALRDNVLDTWSVFSHKGRIKKGDKIILWVTGKAAGCYALATVISDVFIARDDRKQEKYYTDKNDISEHERVKISIDTNLWSTPVYKDELLDKDEFKDFKAGNQGTNFTATIEQYQIIEEIAQNKLKGNKMEPNYWLFAPGAGGDHWEEFYSGNIMAIGWDYLGDLKSFKDKNSIAEAIRQQDNDDGSKKNNATSCYSFANDIAIGDYVFAKSGRSRILGFGTVTSEYKYDSSRTSFKQVRNVQWLKKGEWEVADNKKFAFKTLTKITQYKDFVEYLTNLLDLPKNKTVAASEPNNLIIFGPPGTGKTYKLEKEFFPKYTDYQKQVSQDELLDEIAAKYPWWQIVGAVVMDLGPSKVPDIFTHPLLQAKDRISNQKNPRAMIWSMLQQHTIIDCDSVKYSKRFEPLFFSKNDNSEWSIIKKVVDAEVPEIAEIIEQISKKQPSIENKKRYSFVTFHQSFSYEEFVEGIRPVLSEAEDVNEISYEVIPGIFSDICEQSNNDPDNRYAIFIDEINRGNISKIFGELITLIEIDKRKGMPNEISVKLPYSKRDFAVPSNLDIIGTMNTADRSIALMDSALRRRFDFLELMPDADLIPGSDGIGNIEDNEGGTINLRKLCNAMNKRIEFLLHRDQTIGHSYFIKVKNIEDLINTLCKNVIPLLQEYFYEDWHRLQLVFKDVIDSNGKAHSNQIICHEEIKESDILGFDHDDYEDIKKYWVSTTINADAIRKVYE